MGRDEPFRPHWALWAVRAVQAALGPVGRDEQYEAALGPVGRDEQFNTGPCGP